MKIHNVTQLTPSSTARETTDSAQATRAGQRAPATPASNLNQLQQANLSDTRDVDALRVEELREAIASGAFTVHADRIADSLIASLSEQPTVDES